MLSADKIRNKSLALPGPNMAASSCKTANQAGTWLAAAFILAHWVPVRLHYAAMVNNFCICKVLAIFIRISTKTCALDKKRGRGRSFYDFWDCLFYTLAIQGWSFRDSGYSYMYTRFSRSLD